MACDRDRFDPFAKILTLDMQRSGCPWEYCGRCEMRAYETVLWKPGMESGDLFLIQSGKIGRFPTLPDGNGEWPSPEAVYTHGWFLNRQAFLYGLTRGWAVCLEDGELIFFNQAQWAR